MKEYNMEQRSGRPNLLNHFFLPEDQHLFDYDQIFAVSSIWIELGMEDVEATFDLYVRGMPKKRNFLLFGGLEEMVQSILSWTFTDDEVDFLRKSNIIAEKAAKRLRNFKFGGDLWAMPEGTVFFSGETVVRITGKIWEVNLFTFFLINALSSNTIFLSKIARSVLAAGKKILVVTAPVVRAHANEASLKFGRAAYMLGSPSTLVPAFARKFNLPPYKLNIKAYHAFIKSFPTELEAMRAASKAFSPIGLMVDTYDFKKGVANAITVAKEANAQGRAVSALVIDSGKDAEEFSERAHYCRTELDTAGLTEVRITVTGNFNEEKIAKLVALGAPANSVIACTELVTSSDDPVLEAVFKLAEFKKEGKTHRSAKLTEGKESYPGRKQVFRSYESGRIKEDILGLEGEELGTLLLSEIIRKGELVVTLPSLDELRDYTLSQLETLPETLKQIDKVYEPPLQVSPELKKLFEKHKREHLESEL